MDSEYGDRIAEYDIGIVQHGAVQILAQYDRKEGRLARLNESDFIWPGGHKNRPVGHPMPCGWDHELCRERDSKSDANILWRRGRGTSYIVPARVN